MDLLQQFITRHAVDGCIALADELAIAATQTLSLRKVEEQALILGVMPKRLMRNCLSCEQQLRLLRAKVAVIGCGGLGGTVAEILSRLGIGSLRLVDPDSFEEHNLNRQRFATLETLGFPKVNAAKAALKAINPVTEIEAIHAEFNEADIQAAETIVDCLDSIGKRQVLAALCTNLVRPLIHGAVQEWYGQVGIATSANDLIANLYPSTLKNSPLPFSPRVIAPTVSAIASLQAAETCKLLLGLPSVLSCNWLSCNLLDTEYDCIPIVPTP